MKVSVIIPTFNQCDALQITLESFARQKEVPGLWELILVDDGSNDGTHEFMRAYDPRVYARL
jgi:glycosyltransferase involved in cell wall biosynthesis